VAHRVFVLVLYATYVALLVPVARRFGTGAPAVLLAGIVMLAAWYGVYHYVWITDGNHVLQGLSFATSALLLLSGIERADRVRLGLSVASLGSGLLVREDTLAVVPVLLLLGHLHARSWPRARARWHAYATAVLLLCGLLLVYRALVVPQAPPPGRDVRSFAVAVAHALNPVGSSAFDATSRALVLAGWAALALVARLALARALARLRRGHLRAGAQPAAR
jgi:hypothetical protein